MASVVTSTSIPSISVRSKLDPAFLALSRLRRRRTDECVEVCDKILSRQPLDRAAQHIKCCALTSAAWIEELDADDESIGDVLLDDQAMAKAPRPGTSLRPATRASDTARLGTAAASNRPTTAGGRPLTGYARPNTQSRTMTRGGRLDTAAANRPTTGRPLTMAGRIVRLGTQSMLQVGDTFLDPNFVDIYKISKRPIEARATLNYWIYAMHDFRKACELAAECTKRSQFEDWWWKARLGRCYAAMGLLRDAEMQFLSSLRKEEMIGTYIELGSIYLRMDQPNAALDTYTRASEKFPGDITLILACARVYDALNDEARAVAAYKKVLHYDSANVEALACLASHAFYSDAPELALRYYRRLLQMGVQNTELWNNLGLCCFYASQYDLCLPCFTRALRLSDDNNASDVWYNIAHVALGIGDLQLASQAFKLSISVNPNHAEAYNNIGVLEMKKGSTEIAATYFERASSLSPHLFEPLFNSALLAWKAGDLEESYSRCMGSLEAFPQHTDSQELLKLLKASFGP